MSDVDPLWVVAVLMRWQPCGYALLKDLRRWIVTKYLLDPMICVICMRALHASWTTHTQMESYTYYLITHGRKFKRKYITWRHIPAVLDYPDAYNRAVERFNAIYHFRSMQFPFTSPEYEILQSGKNWGIDGRDMYVPTLEQYNAMRANNTLTWQLIHSYQSIHITENKIMEWADMSVMFRLLATPHLIKAIVDGVKVENEPLLVDIEYYSVYQDCLRWHELSPCERGKLLIAELQVPTAHNRIYVRSGVEIIVSLRDLRVSDWDNILIGLYVAGVKFII